MLPSLNEHFLQKSKLYSWQKNNKRQFVHCSESVYELGGYDSPHDLVGKRDEDLVWCDRAHLYNEEELVVLKGSPVCHIQLQTTVFGLLKIMVTKSPMFNCEGEVVGTIGTSIDVSDLAIIRKSGFVDVKGNLHYENDRGKFYFTKREAEVLKWLMFGFTAAQIAERFNRSARTVEQHITSIKRKMQCKTKGDVIVESVKSGLIYFCFE